MNSLNYMKNDGMKKNNHYQNNKEKQNNIVLLGGAGFIGTNLVLALSANKNNKIKIVDKSLDFCKHIIGFGLENVSCEESAFSINTDFDKLTKDQDIVYHLISTTVPTTSNQHISDELMNNVVVTSKLLDSCVKNRIKKIVFMSSGGTVYGKTNKLPIKEDYPTNPISSYGIQKVTIEKLLYLYWYMFNLDYRIVRLSNPYGPYQRPNGILGAVTTFTYKALKKEPIVVYGNGSIVRDFIYIDDAIRGILSISDGNTEQKVFNLGCGRGTSIKELLNTISYSLNLDLDIVHYPSRSVDVPYNVLDIGRYETQFGSLNPICLCEGIKKTADYLIKNGIV